MKTTSMLLLVAVLLPAAAARAQFGTGDLPQQVRRGMEQAFDDLYNESKGISAPTQVYLEEQVGKEKLDAFLAGAVVRLALEPDGTFAAYSLEGGELLSFRLGREKVELSGDEQWEDPWYKRTGSVELPEKPKPVELSIQAGETNVDVECHNRYARAETTVTFYVGPLDGLFCVGLADAAEDEVAEVGP